MICTKIYEYNLTEDDIKQFIVEEFNRKYNKHLPITKENIKIKFDHQPYCEPKPYATIKVEEGVDE